MTAPGEPTDDVGTTVEVEQPEDSVELHLQRLAGDNYVPVAVASAGQALVSEEPFPFHLEVAALVHRRRGGPACFQRAVRGSDVTT